MRDLFEDSPFIFLASMIFLGFIAFSLGFKTSLSQEKTELERIRELEIKVAKLLSAQEKLELERIRELEIKVELLLNGACNGK